MRSPIAAVDVVLIVDVLIIPKRLFSRFFKPPTQPQGFFLPPSSAKSSSTLILAISSTENCFPTVACDEIVVHNVLKLAPRLRASAKRLRMAARLSEESPEERVGN